MQRRGVIRGGLLLAGLLLLVGFATLAGRRLAGDMTRVEAFRSIPPDASGITWIACHGTPAMPASGAGVHGKQDFCQQAAEQICHGPAIPLGSGAGLPQANRFRERFRCLVVSAR